MISRALQDPFTASDVRLAVSLVTGAGDVLMRLRAEVDAGRRRGGSLELRRTGDAAAQAWLAAALCGARPDDAVLSEEGPDDPRRLDAERVWIVDPLDGTREFAERSPDGHWRDDFAVHVALWRRGEGLTCGAVALPAAGRVYDSATLMPRDEASARAVLDGRRRLRVAVSRTRPPAVAACLVETGEVDLVPLGSTGVKAASVLEGTVDAYVHAGGQHEWDSAAPVAVALASGFVATRLDGSPLAYNRPEPWVPDLVICHPSLAARLRDLLARAGVGAATGPAS